jgi:hypothetical protein
MVMQPQSRKGIRNNLLTFMARPSNQERRRKIRNRLPQMVRVRPSEPTRHNFDEILPTLNSSRESVYFVPQNVIFTLDMRVFVTFPYDTSPGSLNQEYIGKVTRVDKLPGEKQGVAVQLLMPIYLGTKETIR